MFSLLLLACIQPYEAPTPTPIPAPVTPPVPTVVPSPVPPTEPPPFPTPPPVTASPLSILGHGQECAQALGPIPGFDCIEDADPVPVTVDGNRVVVTPGDGCDNPSLLESSCNVWTRAGAKQGTNFDGSPRPEVEFVFTCRSSDTAAPTDAGGIYHDVAMIGHNRATGATCYFQSFPDERIRYFPSPLTSGAVPDYGTVDAAAIWDDPATTANIRCQRCHDADPWIHSPWIDQMARRGAPDEPLVPWTGSNNTPYHIVGAAFSSWDMAHFELPDNNCTSCHRIGTSACRRFVQYSAGDSTSMPLTAATEGSPWMPPNFTANRPAWEAAWRDDVDQILDCCGDPSQVDCHATPTFEGWRYIDPNAPVIPGPDTGLSCEPVDLDLGSQTGEVYTGNTCGQGHDFVRSCGVAGSNGEDLAFTWRAPTAGTFTFETDGSDFDTTLSARTTCVAGDQELACDDDSGEGQRSRFSLTMAAGEEVVLVVDTYDDTCGTVVLTILP